MATDMDLAEQIAGMFSSLLGPGGKIPKDIAKAVAEGIALGRKNAADVAEAELRAAKKELKHNLSSSVRERTQVRSNTARKILSGINRSK